MGKYDDIINLKHHESTKHKRMDIEARVSQFAPFAALTGYSDDVKERARLTSTKLELSDDDKEVISNKINHIVSIIKDKPYISITYFIKDKNKLGGKYITIEGYVKKIDDIYMVIYLDNYTINIDDIIDIEFLK